MIAYFCIYLLGLVSLIIFWVLFKYVLLPYKRMRYYIDDSQCMWVFRPMLGFFLIFYESFKKHGDITVSVSRLASENQDKKYFVTNFLDRACVYFLDNEMCRQFFVDRHLDYRKFPFGIESITRVIGTSFLSSEGTEWKNKRHAISKLFNANFLNSFIPSIIYSVKTYMKGIPEIKESEFTQVEIQEHIDLMISPILMNLFLSPDFNSQVLSEGVSSIEMTKMLITKVAKQTLTIWYILLGPKIFDLGVRKIDKEVDETRHLFFAKAIEEIERQVKRYNEGFLDFSQ